ncbi:hypothetical protein BC828DRAFT_238693 [Blastocladiella britannica]|nr:hypothetical protein BC828DRAFT_238693 [Blastocladiella britannica]
MVVDADVAEAGKQNADIVILTLVPLLLHATRSLPSNSSGESGRASFRGSFLLQFYAANAISAAWYLSNPTNLVLAQAFSINPVRLLAVVGPGALVTHGLLAVSAAWWYPMPDRIAPVVSGSTGDEEGGNRTTGVVLRDKWGAAAHGSVLVACILVLAVSTATSVSGAHRELVPVWLIVLAAGIASVAWDVVADVARVPWKSPSSPSSEDDDGSRGGMDEDDDGIPLTETLPLADPADDAAKHVGDEGNGGGTAHVTATARISGGHRQPGPIAPTPNWVTRMPRLTAAAARFPIGIFPFLLGQFALVQALVSTGVLSPLASGLAATVLAAGGSPMVTVLVVGAIALVLCAGINNLPATVLMAQVLARPEWMGVVDPGTHAAAVAATELASNVGPCLALAGSLAGLLWAGVIASFEENPLRPPTILKQDILGGRSFTAVGIRVAGLPIVAGMLVVGVVVQAAPALLLSSSS